jgi:predicted Ser/Thr protein kinase/regulation of enolase protein 1 (concanavalin A-like superfamily)
MSQDEPAATRSDAPGRRSNGHEETTVDFERGPSPATPPNEYAFLDPPRGAGEIGRLAHYRVRRLIGSGGMGLVFLADDTQLGRPVALKVIRPELAGVPQATARFAREARAAAAIRHDHVVTIYQVGEAGGVAYIAMEYLQGTSLQRWLERGKRPSVDLLLRLAREITSGLAAAHRLGLVHRDIKPGNIWLEAPTGRVKILDFGQARAEREDVQITQSGAIMGTPAFMSPEQAAGEPVEASGDLFSLGGVLYRLATGQLPFQGRTIIAVLNALSNQTPTRPRDLNPKLPPSVDALIMRLLEKDPARRPASATAVLETISEIERQLAVARQAGELGLAPPAALELAAIEAASTPTSEPTRPIGARRAAPSLPAWRVAAIPAGLAALALVSFLAWPRGAAVQRPAGKRAEAVAERPSPDPPAAPSVPSEVVPAPAPAPPPAVEPQPATVEVQPAPRTPVGLVGSRFWGEFVDPEGDCDFTPSAEGDAALIRVPGSAHLLSVERGQVNAPRLLRPVDGDFEASVRVGGIETPGRKSSTRLYGAYHGAGLLIWQDERNYFRFELAEGYLDGRPRRFLNYEYRRDGLLVSSHSKSLKEDMPFLKIGRRGRTITAAYGPDGKTWIAAEPLESTLSDQVSVGLVAINSSMRPLLAEFSEFGLNEAAEGSPSVPGVEVELTPGRARYGPDEAVEVAIEVRNEAALPVTLPGDRGGERRYRLLVTDANGRPRARSRDEPPDQAPGPVTVLPSGGKLADRIVVKPEGDEWMPGQYTIRVDVVLLGPDGLPGGVVASKPADFVIASDEEPGP